MNIDWNTRYIIWVLIHNLSLSDTLQKSYSQEKCDQKLTHIGVYCSEIKSNNKIPDISQMLNNMGFSGKTYFGLLKLYWKKKYFTNLRKCLQYANYFKTLFYTINF